MTAPSNFKFSLQCGVGNTWVEVTSDVLFEEGPITFTDGRTSQFDGFNPGTFPLTLNNGTGKYTPNSGTTSLAVPLSEGMGVCMQLDGLLLSGTIRSVVLIFPPKEAASKARVRIAVDDMLGNAARHTLTDLADDLFKASSGLLQWPLDDVVGASIAAERSGYAPLSLTAAPTDATFGSIPTYIPVTDTVLTITPNASVSFGQRGTGTTLAYGGTSIGCLGFWIERNTTTVDFALQVNFNPTLVGTFGIEVYTLRSIAGAFRLNANGGANVAGPTFATDRAYFVEITSATTFAAGAWTIVVSLFVDGVSYGSSTYAATVVASLTDASRTPSLIQFDIPSAVGTIGLSRISHTLLPLSELYIGPTTAQNRIKAIAATTPEVTLDTVPPLATAVLARQDVSGDSTLDAWNDVMRTEQGYMWVETSGTLTAPVPKVKIAARNRERAVDYTFDVSEILDPIAFIHSLTNTVSQATANGPTNSATYQDPTLVPLVGSASSSDTVLLRDFNDLYGYASDRVARGVNRGIAIQQITIDATSPQISRWSNLTSIRQGHRLHITGLPTPPLDSSTWDGFVVGRQIDNTQDSQTDEPKSLFTFYLSPWSKVYVYDDATSVYDTATYGY